MLDVLRRGASTWVSKVLLGLLIVSFGIWGIADVFRGFGSNTAYKVGSTEIGVAELDQTYARELQQMSRRLARPFNKTEALKTGVSQQILAKAVTDTTIGEVVHSMRLGISDAEIGKEILADPAFKSASGAFDRNRYVELLRSNGWNEDMYVVKRRADTLRAQVIEGLAGGIQTPKAWQEAIDTFRNETRSIRWVALSAATLGEIAPPAEADLAAFFEARKAAFRAPETRSLVALVLDAAAVAKPGDVTDDDARAEWQRQKERFTTPEKRRIRQLAFDDAAAADAAAAERAAGRSFAEIAEARGQKLDDLDLGLVTRDGLIDPTIAEAAFALPEVGAVSAPVVGRYRTVMLELVEKVPATEKPFAEVADEIRKEIATKRAENDVLSFHDQIEDALAGGAKLPEVAARFGLKPVTVEGLTKDGRLPSGEKFSSLPQTEKLSSLPQTEKLLADAFESDVGVENDPIDLGGHGFMWFALTAVVPAHDQDLATVHDRALAAWKAEETAKRLAAEAAKLTERLAKGDDFAAVATEAGLKLEQTGDIKREARLDTLPPTAVAAAFEGPVGHVAVTSGKGDDRIVLQVVSADAPVFFAETDEAKAIAQQTAGSLQNTLLMSWLARVQQDIGVSANPAVIARVTGKAQD